MEVPLSNLLIAVIAITLAIAAIYWLATLPLNVSRIEQLSLVGYDLNYTGNQYIIIIVVKNKSIYDITINQIVINNHDPSFFGAKVDPFPLFIKAGHVEQVRIYLPKNRFIHGQAVETVLISAEGAKVCVVLKIP